MQLEVIARRPQKGNYNEALYGFQTGRIFCANSPSQQARGESYNLLFLFIKDCLFCHRSECYGPPSPSISLESIKSLTTKRSGRRKRRQPPTTRSNAGKRISWRIGDNPVHGIIGAWRDWFPWRRNGGHRLDSLRGAELPRSHAARGNEKTAHPADGSDRMRCAFPLYDFLSSLTSSNSASTTSSLPPPVSFPPALGSMSGPGPAAPPGASPCCWA